MDSLILSVVARVSLNNIGLEKHYLINPSLALLIYYDGTKIPQSKLISHLTDLEAQLGDLSKAKVPSRIFKLPIAFDHIREKNAVKRYMETQRPYASYLPDNLEFVAKNNGFERKDLVRILLTSKLITVSVGFFAALPLCLPVDPRERMNCPKVRRPLLLSVKRSAS